MTKQAMTSATSDEVDEVERSLELLDRVLSEFDDVENANSGVARTGSSEDDGYVSLNGRRKPRQELPPPPPPSASQATQRIIAHLLPRSSPTGRTNACDRKLKGQLSLTLGNDNSRNNSPSDDRRILPAQTTYPKTRHQRPYGWQNGGVPGRRPQQVQEEEEDIARMSDAANFSDDSLEGVPPPPPPAPVRPSIAWEVPLDDETALYTPGSTKVIGRRRRRSTDRSSTGSVGRTRQEVEEWPDPPTGTEDGSISPLSDSSHVESSAQPWTELSGTDVPSSGTYVVRRVRQRQQLPLPEPRTDSAAFDNIKCLLKEGLIEGLDEAPPDFPPPQPPAMVRVISLPTLPPKQDEEFTETPAEEDSKLSKHDVAIQVSPKESAEGTVTSDSTDSESDRRAERSVVLLNGTDTSSNEALMRELKRTYDTESINNNIEQNNKLSSAEIKEIYDPWLEANEVSQVRVSPESQSSPQKPPKEFKVKVEVLQHEFGPLPPSPVEEVDEFLDVIKSSPGRNKCDRKESFYRCSEPATSDPLGSRVHPRQVDQSSERPPTSLKTRSMDAGFSRNHRSHHSRRDGERRTLPGELPGPRRRGYQKRIEPHMQVSCSLPETPIFSRGGCDIPRTPHRRAPDVPSSTAPRLHHTTSSTTSSAYRSTGMSLGEAMAGAELLRLAGGPGRGWYPRHRQAARPASVENLDRLARPWPPGLSTDHRKPQTLPPNLHPKFFHKSPRDALRRVTSLLIRKGNNKEKKTVLSPTSVPLSGEGSNESGRQKKGFFRSWWKKSRHYSLDQQQD